MPKTAPPESLPSRRVLTCASTRIEAADAVATHRGMGRAERAGHARPLRLRGQRPHDRWRRTIAPTSRQVVNGADLVLADGVPMVWALRAFGLDQRRRVRIAPDLLYELFAACEAARRQRRPLRRQSGDAAGVHLLAGRSYQR